MAFKAKIKITDLPTLPHKNYMNIFRKDVQRAAKFGQTGVVVLSDFKFACGEVGTSFYWVKCLDHSKIITKS